MSGDPRRREWQRRYSRRLRQKASDVLGKECVFCGSTENIHAAHVKDTGLNGAGRGIDRRCRDVIKRPDAYRPMCKKCHRIFDVLVSLRLAEKSEPIPF